MSPFKDTGVVVDNGFVRLMPSRSNECAPAESLRLQIQQDCDKMNALELKSWLNAIHRMNEKLERILLLILR